MADVIQWYNNNQNAVQLNPDPPHGINGQCGNPASSWSMAQGGPELFGIGDSSTAYTIWQTFNHPFYQRVTGNYTAGDIIFFAPNNAAAGTGDAGHVDVFLQGGVGRGFDAADADWNGSPNLQRINHSLDGVVGAFRPVNNGGSMDAQVAEQRRVDLVNIGEEVSVYDGASHVQDIINNIRTLQQQAADAENNAKAAEIRRQQLNQIAQAVSVPNADNGIQPILDNIQTLQDVFAKSHQNGQVILSAADVATIKKILGVQYTSNKGEIKMANQVSPPVQPVQDVKPGYKTTEFWLHLLVQVVVIGQALNVQNPVLVKAIAVLASILGALGYAQFRSSVKSAAIQANSNV